MQPVFVTLMKISVDRFTTRTSNLVYNITSSKVKNDHRSKFSNLSNWKEEAWKKSGLHIITSSVQVAIFAA